MFEVISTPSVVRITVDTVQIDVFDTDDPDLLICEIWTGEHECEGITSNEIAPSAFAQGF